MICSGDSAAEWLRERTPLPSTPPPSTYKQQKKGEGGPRQKEGEIKDQEKGKEARESVEKVHIYFVHFKPSVSLSTCWLESPKL